VLVFIQASSTHPFET